MKSKNTLPYEIYSHVLLLAEGCWENTGLKYVVKWVRKDVKGGLQQSMLA